MFTLLVLTLAWMPSSALGASDTTRSIGAQRLGSVSAAERGRFVREPSPYLVAGQPGPAPFRFQAVMGFPLSDIPAQPGRVELEFVCVHATPAVPRPAFVTVEHVLADQAGVALERGNELHPHPDAIAEAHPVKQIPLPRTIESQAVMRIDVSEHIRRDLAEGHRQSTFRIRLTDGEGQDISDASAMIQILATARPAEETETPRLIVQETQEAVAIGPDVEGDDFAAVEPFTPSGDLRLIAEGLPTFSVEEPANRSELVDFALASLGEVVEAMTGAALPRGGGTPVKIDMLIDPGSFDAASAAESYRVETSGATIRIVGGSDRALLWGVTHFAELAFGASWPDVGPVHVAGPTDALSVAPESLEIETSPTLRYRGFHLVRGDDGPQFDREVVDWMARQRMNIKTTHPFHFPRVYDRLINRGIEPNTNSHSYFWLVPSEMAEERPEFFPLVDGRRLVVKKHGGIGMQLNVSAPGLPEHIAKRARGIFDRYPEVETFGVWPNDGSLGWSESEGDRELDGPFAGRVDEEGRPIHTNRVVALANRVARLTAESHPDKLIGTGAYSTFREPPTIDIEPNVIIDFTTMGRNYLRPLTDPTDEANALVMRQLRGWLDKTPRVRMYEYHSSGGLGIGYLPMPAWRALCEELPELVSMGVQGMYSEHFPSEQNAASLGLTRYVFARSLWEPGQSFEHLLAEFCDANFGPASKAMQDFFLTYESAIRKKVDHIGYNTSAVELFDALAGEPIARLADAVARAEREVEAGGTQQHADAVAQQRRLVDKMILSTSDPRTADGIGPNLLHNAGAEMHEVNAPGWFRGVNSGDYDFAIDRDVAYEGRHSLRISAREPGWGRWMQSVATRPGEQYVFAVYVRTSDNDDATGFVWAHQGGHHTAGALLRYGNTRGEWKRVVLPPLKANGTAIMLFLESRGEGTVHFDSAFGGRVLEEMR